MKPLAHGVFGAISLACMATFSVATLTSELFLERTDVVLVKQVIVYGLSLLIPALMATGASGFRLQGASAAGSMQRKANRMRLVAANGLCVLLPCALTLNAKAKSGDFGLTFWAIQAVELGFATLQLTLVALNFRDGLRLSKCARTRPKCAAVGSCRS